MKFCVRVTNELGKALSDDVGPSPEPISLNFFDRLKHVSLETAYVKEHLLPLKVVKNLSLSKSKPKLAETKALAHVVVHGVVLLCENVSSYNLVGTPYALEIAGLK